MEEQQLPSMSEKKHGKHTVIIVTIVSLIVIAVIATAIALWPEKKSVTPPGYIVSSETVVEEALSQEELETALEAVREYMPTVVALTSLDPKGDWAGNFGVKDANGAELGLVILDNSGKISSERIYSVGFEKAKDIAVGIMADKGIDPELLLLEYSYISHASEHVTEYYFIYRPHIGNVPVFNQDSCSITLSPEDGSIMFFSLNGSFVLPDTEPTETLVTEEEAVTLALDGFRKWAENSYMAQDSQGAMCIDYVVSGPVDFIYSQMATEDGGIAPLWKIPVERYITMPDDDGNPVRYNASGGCMYEVNATTGEAFLAAQW